MGLFGSGKDDTRAKIEELKAKMQASGSAQQPWQGQPEPQGWQPPREQAPPMPQYNQTPQQQIPPQAPQQPAPQQNQPQQTYNEKPREEVRVEKKHEGILLELGDGMTLNLPIKEKMELTEFLRIADRVRELKKIDHTS